MKHYSRLFTLIIILGLTLGMLLALFPIQPEGLRPALAQDNLLQNPGFDGAMVPGSGGAVPAGWAVWGGPESDKETLSALTRSAPNSWRLRKEFGAYTGGGRQTVAVQPGATYRFSIYAMIWTCDDEQFACRNDQGTYSDTSSNGVVRIGIDPDGGTDPFAGDVVWSGYAQPFTWSVFQLLQIEATASGSQMTVFTYYSSSVPMRYHDAFWDDASLVMVTAPSQNPVDSNPPAADNNSAPAQPAARTVADPVEKADGSIVHIVVSGNTLSGIATAYGISLATLREQNGLQNTDVIVPGQEVIIQPAPNAVVPTTQAAVAGRGGAGDGGQVAAAPTVTPFWMGIGTATPTQPALSQTDDIQVVNVDEDDGASDEDDEPLVSREALIAIAVILSVGALAMGGFGLVALNMLPRR
jgi:LysM repeat protein